MIFDLLFFVSLYAGRLGARRSPSGEISISGRFVRTASLLDLSFLGARVYLVARIPSRGLVRTSPPLLLRYLCLFIFPKGQPPLPACCHRQRLLGKISSCRCQKEEGQRGSRERDTQLSCVFEKREERQSYTEARTSCLSVTDLLIAFSFARSVHQRH